MADPAASAWSRRSSTAQPAHRPSSASEVSRASASKTCSVDAVAGSVRRLGARAGHAVLALRAPRARRGRRGDRAGRRAHAANSSSGARVGVLTPKLPHDLPPSAVVVGTPADPDEYARSLYRLLRAADDQHLDVVLAVRAARGRDRRGGGRPAAARRGCSRCMTARSACSTPASVGSRCSARSSTCCPTSARSTSVTPADFPYGPKPHEDVLKYALEITDVLLERGVKALVVACNSAAAAALEALDERLEIPVLGVIEPGHAGGHGRHPDRPDRRDRHRRHDRLGCLPARGPAVLAASGPASGAEIVAHVRSLPGIRGVRRGRRRRFRPGPRARRTAARTPGGGPGRHA